MAHLHQPLRRGDDALRGHVAGLFPLLHLGRPWFVCWLFPYPSTLRALAAIQSAARVGRVRHLHLLHRLRPLLVRGAASRTWPPCATRRTDEGAARIIYGIFALGWRGSARPLAPLPHRLPAAGRPLHAAGALGAHHRVLRLRHLACCPAGTPPSSRPTSWPAPSSPASPWCSPSSSRRARCFGLQARDHRAAPGEHDQGASSRTGHDGLLRLHDGALHRLVLAATRYESYTFFDTRQRGPYAPVYWLMIACNVRHARRSSGSRGPPSVLVLWIASILVNVGMWCERFIIIVTSLHRDFLPSSLGHVHARPGSTGASTSAPWASSASLFLLFLTLRAGGRGQRGEGAAARAGARRARRACRARSPPGAARTAGRVAMSWIVAEFGQDEEALLAAARAAPRPWGAARSSTPTRPIRCTASTRRWA